MAAKYGHMRRQIIATILLCAAGCASLTVAPIFRDATPLIGQSAAVEGYLKFGFENRNLFPTADWEADLRSKRCVPIAIRSSDIALLRTAERLNGQRVIISGEVTKLLSRTELSNSFCKSVGLMVADIQAALPR